MEAHAGERDSCAFAPRAHAARQAGCARRSRDPGRLKLASVPPMRGGPVCAESLLAKNGGDPVKAFQEGQILFNSSAIYVSGMAAHHGNTSAISSVSAGQTCTMSCCTPLPPPPQNGQSCQPHRELAHMPQPHLCL